MVPHTAPIIITCFGSGAVPGFPSPPRSPSVPARAGCNAEEDRPALGASTEPRWRRATCRQKAGAGAIASANTTTDMPRMYSRILSCVQNSRNSIGATLIEMEALASNSEPEEAPGWVLDRATWSVCTVQAVWQPDAVSRTRSCGAGRIVCSDKADCARTPMRRCRRERCRDHAVGAQPACRGRGTA